MMILLLLMIVTQNQSHIEDFINNSGLSLSYLVCGSEVITNTKPLSFGIEANYSDYKLIHYDVIARAPSVNGYVTIKKGSFYPYLKLGFYLKNNNTNNTTPFFNFGFNFEPKFITWLIFCFGYGALAPIEYYPEDPYFNYNYKKFLSVNLSLIGFKKISVFTPFLTVGLRPYFINGVFRKDFSGFEKKFSKLILGWHFGLGFKLFFAKINAGVVNNRLSASTSFNL